jgi:hypothetical protein
MKKSEKTEKIKKKRKTLHFLIKITKYAPYQTVSVGLLFVSVQSKHRNSLFRYRSETTETNVLFQIVPKLVSVRLFRIETSFEGHPNDNDIKTKQNYDKRGIFSVEAKTNLLIPELGIIKAKQSLLLLFAGSKK